MLTFGSLFSGIGGLDLGLERAGMKCVWQSEIEPYACKVLAKHWPDIPNLGDIREIDWSTVPRTDVICGGYPCQPFSLAGSRNGADDPRHLWPMFARAISVVRPRYALLENVSGHLSLGFGQVLADLAALRYDAEWDCIPAAAVGAPHLRDRLFVIATRQDILDTDSESESGRAEHGTPAGDRAEQRRFVADTNDRRSHDTLRARWNAPWDGSTIVADTNYKRLQPSRGEPWELARDSDRSTRATRGTWETEPSVGRVANGISNRLDRLRGLGNAVVPQVAEHVARIIIKMEETQ